MRPISIARTHILPARVANTKIAALHLGDSVIQSAYPVAACLLHILPNVRETLFLGCESQQQGIPQSHRLIRKNTDFDGGSCEHNLNYGEGSLSEKGQHE
jgi:hypothetical protein